MPAAKFERIDHAEKRAARFERIDWYDTPRWYDLVFDVDTKSEADFLEAVQREHGRTRGKSALEPACGSGRLVAELARRGWSVEGSDLNPRMLEFARERLAKRRLRAQLTLGDMSDFHVRKRVDLAHCLVSTFKYLLSEEQATAHLRCIARALKPGGVYVLGFHLSEYGVHKLQRERHRARQGGLEVVCNTQVWPADRRTRLEHVRTRLVARERGLERRSQTEWDFRTYDVGEVRALFARVPELEHVATYDFTHDIEQPRELDGELLDIVLVLRRR